MTTRPFVSAILAAAGLGTRAGGGVPKQFQALAGQTMLERSLAALARHPRIDQVVVALPAAHLDPLPACLEAEWPCTVQAVAGGERRRDSVARAFAQVSSVAAVVLVHDAARPFLTARLIDRMIDAAAASGAAVPAVRAHDTVKRGSRRDGAVWVDETLPRDAIYLVQTPQAFQRAVLARALAAAGDDDATDEAGLVERAGGAVELVDGDIANVKITTAEDLTGGARRGRLRFGAARRHGLRPAPTGAGPPADPGRRRRSVRARARRPLRCRHRLPRGDRRRPGSGGRR